MCITVFCKENNAYKKHITQNFKIHLSNGITISDSGYIKSDKCVIRIFEKLPFEIFPEDKIELNTGLDAPSLDAFTVVRVTHNNKGTHPHIKVECV